MALPDFLNPIKGLANAASGIIDQFVESPEEAAQAKQMLMEEQRKSLQSMYEARASIVESQKEVIKSEAQSDHWLAANIRPGTLAAFVLIALYAGIFAPIFGWPAPMLGEVPDRVWTIIMTGLGGYIGVRTAEKIAPGMMDSWARGRQRSSDDIDEVTNKVLQNIADARSSGDE